MFSPVLQEKRKSTKRKAPAVPMTPEEAEAARLAAEQRALERREAKRCRDEELERDLAMMEAEEEEEEERARGGGRRRRRVSSDDEEYIDEDEEDDDQVYCVCRRRHREGMEYIACDSCSEWFHPQCMNTTLEVCCWCCWVVMLGVVDDMPPTAAHNCKNTHTTGGGRHRMGVSQVCTLPPRPPIFPRR